jgi:fructose-1,6-bisphosphatase/inositol monophosphatase family enzyme
MAATVASAGLLTDDSLLAVLHDAASAVRTALDRLADWGLAGDSRHQYRHDVVADEAARTVLAGAGLGVLSEESGAHALDAPIVVVLDPVDGSTNASRGIPWWNTSLCALDAEGPRVALVVDQVHGTRFDAARGGGARRDGRPISPSACTRLGDAVIGLNGFPRAYLGWKQFRALGATALDLCAVAAGVLDGYVDCTRRGSAGWDFLGGLLVCQEAGAVVADAHGDDLVVRTGADRRCPVAAATPSLLADLLARRAKFS